MPDDYMSYMTRSMLETMIVRKNARDYAKECGYPITITAAEYYQAYTRNGLCKRIVHLYPDECAQVTPEVNEEGSDDQETAWEKEFQEHVEAVNLWHYMLEVDRLAGVVRFGILLVGLSDGQELDQPVTPIGDMRVIYLRAFSERHVTIIEYDRDTKSARYGQPLMYQILVNDMSVPSAGSGNTKGATTESLTVHHSRVIHVSDTGEVFAAPRLEDVWNWAQVDLSKLVGGGAEMFWQGAFPGLFFSVGDGVDLQKEDETSIREQAFNYQNTLTRVMHMQGVTVEQLSPVIADPTAHFNIVMQLCALAKGCPLPVFLGSQPGGLSADSGMRGSDEWSVRKQMRRERHIAPNIVGQYIRKAINVWKVLTPAKFKVVYPNPHAMTETEKAANALVWVQVLGEYIAKGCDVLLSPMSLLTEICGMDMERATRILEAAEAYAEEVKSQQPEEPGVDGAEEVEAPTV